MVYQIFCLLESVRLSCQIKLALISLRLYQMSPKKEVKVQIPSTTLEHVLNFVLDLQIAFHKQQRTKCKIWIWFFYFWLCCSQQLQSDNFSLFQPADKLSVFAVNLTLAPMAGCRCLVVSAVSSGDSICGFKSQPWQSCFSVHFLFFLLSFFLSSLHALSLSHNAWWHVL